MLTTLATPDLVARLTARLEPMLASIETLVVCESPSSDPEAVRKSADVVSSVGRSILGVAAERVTVDRRSHLLWRFGAGPSRVLLLAHHDTAWPVGSLETHPFVISDGLLRGPGCFDMKAGLVIGLEAVSMLSDRTGVAILVTGDEEIGSPSSRALVEELAEGCAAVLVLEPSADGGALKTRRKGVSLYEVAAVGRDSHAGIEPEQGVNATIELAHQVLAIAALADPAAGTSVTPTLLVSGSAVNTVPGRGTLAIDVRAWSAAELERVDRGIRALEAAVAGAQIEVRGGVNRAPLESSVSSRLFVRAATLANALSVGPLLEAATGGGSDGNLTAGLGIPTLDGLGAIGGGAHSPDEHVVVSQLPGRAALVAALIADILADG